MADGATLLRGFLDRHGLSQGDAAEALGVSDPTVHDWLKGAKRPRSHHRDAVATWTSGEVPAVAWVLDEEAEKLAAVRPFDPTPA
jgi:hypothetical protein